MKYILPYHLGGGNRGCEGISRGISKILNVTVDDFILFEKQYQEYLIDKSLSLDRIGILRYNNDGNTREFLILLFKLLKKCGCKLPYLEYRIHHYSRDLNTGDTLIITGGDIYCYRNGYEVPNYLIKKAKEKGLKTVLFCESFDSNLLTPDAIKGLKCYDTILTRESISSTTLNSFGIKNTLVPDPAFVLEPVAVELPEFFKSRDIVGLNISPYTNTSPFFEDNIVNLCEYCGTLGMTVCLIPHVFWKREDDRKVMKALLPRLGKNVHYLDSSSLSYLQIRYIISNCKYFIGGRTHSVISAYCSKVPCIALSYSVKSKGIAHDIGMPDYTVVDSLYLKNKNDLLNAFKQLMADEQRIMDVYSNIDEYISHCYAAKNLMP